MKSFLREQTLLIAERDTSVRQSLAETLSWFCRRIEAVGSGTAAWEAYQTHRPAIVIMEIDLPGIDGIELAGRIRRVDKTTRIVFLSARTDTATLLRAVELGLSRYLVKPATEEQLIGALEKCVAEMDESSLGRTDMDSLLPLGHGFLYRCDDGQVLRNGIPVKMTKSQSAILETFLKHPEKIITYECLQNQVWGEKYMSPAAIRSMIRDLREKLYRDLIENVAGIGYKITPAA